jgi:tetratricopeptide (TPR) repeat protein
MGVIFRAHDALREQDVAFKRLVVAREPLRAHMTALFEREFHTLAQLAHPGIVEAYDYGIDEEGPYYTMELLTGSDLRAGVPMPAERACKLLCEVASALALVHARRLVHRDLSPANVLLTNSGRAKLIDFGALTSFGRPRQIVGTAAFIAPECLADRDIDQRADLYGLGALAYWILTGARAVQAETVNDLLAAWKREIRPPSQCIAGLPRGLDELVLSLLQHDPLARPASAAYVIDRLSAIADLPLEEDARRVSASYVAYPPLVGRAEELGQLERRLHESAQGRGHTAWVEAAQGVGRSALLDQLALHAQLTGATVLRAQGGVQGSALSLARSLVATALRTHPDLRDYCARAHPTVSASCLPAVDQRRSRQALQTPAAAAEGYAELMSGMQDCLLELSRLNPLVLVIDDVHRADPESAGLLASLAHEARENSLLLVVSAASDEPTRGPPALAKLSELAHPIALSALSEVHISELVTAIFGVVPNATRLARWLYAQSEGNPQRCMDLLRLLQQREVVRYQGGLFSLPYDVGTQIDAAELGRVPSARLEALGADARRVAQLLSIEEEALALDVASAALDLHGQRLFAAVEALVERGIAVKLDGRLALSSRPLRSAAASSLSSVRRCDLHLGLARALLCGQRASEQRIMAGFHLLRGGRRDEGADTLVSEAVRIAYSSEGVAKAVPALEQALEVYRAQGRSEQACLLLLVPLTVAGFYGDPRLSVRYLERTYEILLQVSGTTLAARLSRFVGSKLALLIGLAYCFVRFLVAPRAELPPHFRLIYTALFGVASAGAAAMTCAYEQEQTVRIGERLAPFAALGRNSGAHAVRELCQGLSEIMLSVQADCAARMQRLVALLSGPRKLAGLDAEIRTQILLGAVYVRGISEVYAGNPLVLELAAQLEQSGRAFSKPRAALLRMCHFGFRGEQEAAARERARAEVLALLGGTSWSAMSAMAIRQLLMCQWTRDSVGLLRVVHELQDLTAIAPALDTHRELGEAYLELLRGRPERALETYERLLDAPRRYPVVNWQPEAAHRAQALNALGRHAEARAVCLDVVSKTRPMDQRMRFLYQPAQQELAIAEALLGGVFEAETRLERLIEESSGLSNPLLSGSLHRDRARVALLAGDGAAFELHLAKVAEAFRATQNPCLIQQYEALAAQGAGVGLRALPQELPSGLCHAGDVQNANGTSSMTTVIEGNHGPTVPSSNSTLTTLIESERAPPPRKRSSAE